MLDSKKYKFVVWKMEIAFKNFRSGNQKIEKRVQNQFLFRFLNDIFSNSPMPLVNKSNPTKATAIKEALVKATNKKNRL